MTHITLQLMTNQLIKAGATNNDTQAEQALLDIGWLPHQIDKWAAMARHDAEIILHRRMHRDMQEMEAEKAAEEKALRDELEILREENRILRNRLSYHGVAA